MSLNKLSNEELSRPYSQYYNRKLSRIPAGIIDEIESGPVDPRDALDFREINKLLEPGYLNNETGYCIMPDGSAYVAMLTDMPHVTGEMIDWWFVWHPQEDLRYKIWYPGAHISNRVENMNRLTDESLSLKERYTNNTNYPVEDVGSGVQKLFIKFVPPEEFNFDVANFKKANVATVICAIAGFPASNLQHTYMVHFVRKTAKGVEMRSRFWIGYNIRLNGFSEYSVVNRVINSKMIKSVMIKEHIARGMAHHCAQEYCNLAEILPRLYKQYGY